MGGVFEQRPVKGATRTGLGHTPLAGGSVDQVIRSDESYAEKWTILTRFIDWSQRPKTLSI